MCDGDGGMKWIDDGTTVGQTILIATIPKCAVGRAGTFVYTVYASGESGACNATFLSISTACMSSHVRPTLCYGNGGAVRAALGVFHCCCCPNWGRMNFLTSGIRVPRVCRRCILPNQTRLQSRALLFGESARPREDKRKRI